MWFLVVGGLLRKQQGKGYNYSQLHPDRYTQTPFELKDYSHSCAPVMLLTGQGTSKNPRLTHGDFFVPVPTMPRQYCDAA